MTTDTRPLAVGDRIKDNDPRMGGDRVLVITEITAQHVIASRNGAGLWPARISTQRIYTDGKPRRIGFSRIEP